MCSKIQRYDVMYYKKGETSSGLCPVDGGRERTE
jgi:hypothetical protein